MTCKSIMITAVAACLALALAGCRNPPPSTALKSNSPALRGIKSWVDAGAGQYNAAFTGSLDYNNHVSAIVGHLDLINAYRFTLTLQSTDGRYAFILHRNWAGTHFLVQPRRSDLALARAIGEGISLAFRRPEGPWHAAVKASGDVVVYKDANDNRFLWNFAVSPNGLLPTHLSVKTPSGANYAVTFNSSPVGEPESMVISDSALNYILRLRQHTNSATSITARIP